MMNEVAVGARLLIENGLPVVITHGKHEAIEIVHVAAGTDRFQRSVDIVSAHGVFILSMDVDSAARLTCALLEAVMRQREDKDPLPTSGGGVLKLSTPRLNPPEDDEE